jgi:hypothetical protein
MYVTPMTILFSFELYTFVLYIHFQSFLLIYLVSSAKNRSSHSRTSNRSPRQETCDNEVNNAVIIDIQLSNAPIFRVAEMQGIYTYLVPLLRSDKYYPQFLFFSFNM